MNTKPSDNSVRELFRQWFSLTDTKPRTLLREVYGGLVMYLVSVYTLSAAPIWQAGPCLGCISGVENATSLAGYTGNQFRALPAAVALAAGISTLFMGIYGNMPIIVSPGITGIAFQGLAANTSPSCAQAASLVGGLFILTFALLSKKIKIISSTPEDFRLGVAAGKGGLIALIALRNCGLVSAGGIGFDPSFNYNVVLSLAGLTIIMLAQQKGYLVFSFIGEIAIITTISLIIRGATGTSIVSDSTLPDLSLVARPPSFAEFTYENGFVIAKYIIQSTLHILIDMVATVTALILMSVVRFRFGYDKEAFTAVLSESTKCFHIFVSIGLCQVLVSPFLGVAPVTPFIQSTAGIAVGARTGLSAVVCGILFLLSSLFAAPISSIIPYAATGPVVFVACLPVIQGLRYLDYTNPGNYIPSLMAFFMITLAYSIGVGVSFPYMILFAGLVLSANWSRITPQIVASFSMCATLLLLETGLVSTLQGLAGVVGGFALLTLASTLLIFSPCSTYFVSTSETVNNRSPANDLGGGAMADNYPSASPPSDQPGSKRVPAFLAEGGQQQAHSSARDHSSPPSVASRVIDEIIVI